MTENQLWNWMMAGNYPPGYPDISRPELVSLHRRALATLAEDVPYPEEVRKKVVTPAMRRRGNTTKTVWKKIPRGTRVNVVMASRMGDFGITTDLTADRGYFARTSSDEDKPDILIDIQPIEDPRPDKVRLAFGSDEIQEYSNTEL